jgi:hypothetical protein
MRALPHRHWSKQADGGAAHLVAKQSVGRSLDRGASLLCRRAIKIFLLPMLGGAFHCGLDLLLSRCAILGRSGEGVRPERERATRMDVFAGPLANFSSGLSAAVNHTPANTNNRNPTSTRTIDILSAPGRRWVVILDIEVRPANGPGQF